MLVGLIVAGAVCGFRCAPRVLIEYTRVSGAGRCVVIVELVSLVIQCQVSMHSSSNFGLRVCLVLNFGRGSAGSWVVDAVAILLMLSFCPFGGWGAGARVGPVWWPRFCEAEWPFSGGLCVAGFR